jgi:transcriptional regulator with XRE-family HTH domain
VPRNLVSDPQFPGDVLTQLRLIRGWSQKELAAAAGLTQAVISRYERAKPGKPAIPWTVLRRLVAAMGLPLQLVPRAVAFLDESRQTWALAASGGTDDPLAAEVDALAAELAQGWETLTRSTLTRYVAAARHFAARERAALLWARLRAYSPEQRMALVREVAEFQDAALCVLVCEESVTAAADLPAPALELAGLAVEIAARADAPEPWRHRLEGYAWAFLGNARRVAGKPAAAEEAFSRSARLWEAGAPADPSPLDSTRLLDLEASLRQAQGRLPEALALLDRALRVHTSGNAAARLLLKKAKALEGLDEYDGAVAVLRHAAPLIDEQAEPRLQLVLRFNLAYDLCHLGRAAEVEPTLPELEALVTSLGNRLDLVRFHGLEGTVAAARGRTDEAIAILQQVRADFLDLGVVYDAALKTLELAVLYAGEGRTAEVKALARQAAPVFHAEGVHAEARKALDLFRRAAEQERLTLELARRLLAYLHRARNDPALRFEVAA